MIIVIIATIIAISSVVANYIFYKHIQKEEIEYKQELKKKYIKCDVRLYNAAYEAYEHAKEEHRDFEAQKFRELLNDLKGRR